MGEPKRGGKGAVERYAARVGYDEEQVRAFGRGGHRVRHVERLAEAAPRHTIEAEVVASSHCNSGHVVGQRLVLDVDGNLISKRCPKKVCVYLVSQLTVPVALINERLSERLDPNGFHFMRIVRCPDAGVHCLGYGEVTMRVRVVSRQDTPAAGGDR